MSLFLCHQIYDIEKIKIIHDNARVKDLDKNNLYNNLLAKLRLHFGETLYRGFIEDKVFIDEITDKYILFDVTNIRILAKEYGQKFKNAFDETIKELAGKQPPGGGQISSQRFLISGQAVAYKFSHNQESKKFSKFY